MHHQKLIIKNMVCPRCVTSVENILRNLKIPFYEVKLGEVHLPESLSAIQKTKLQAELKKVGFELIETRLNALVEKIKHEVSDYLNDQSTGKKLKLSSYITQHIPNDYSYLSDLFSSVEGTTIEHYFIQKRIEKVKEYLVYNQLSLSEIADLLGFSSVHHLSAQFKKETGLTPSYFRKLGEDKKKASKA